MARKRTNIFWTMSKEDLLELLENSESVSDILRKCGVRFCGGNHQTLYTVLEERGINADYYKLKYGIIHSKKTSEQGRRKKLPLELALVENSSYSRKDLKRRLIEDKILENKCQKCKLGNEWGGEPLSLQMDHINGVYNDNRLENLRLLCPNCHSQTEDFAGRSLRVIKNCKKCNGLIIKTTKKNICKTCAKEGYKSDNQKLSYLKKRKFNITKEELQDLIWTQKLPYTTIGKLYGVSDNAVRKRCLALGVELRTRLSK
jgi:Zn finger protein HypA/HybF involved in hydrogenase expression